MTHRQPTTRPGWWRFLLAALAAALVALLGVGTASATTPTTAETRVGVSTPATAHVVGVHESVSAGQRWDKAPPTAEIASATGVAANTAAKMPRVLRVGEVKLPAVPKGGVGTPVDTGKGLEYAIPRGTPEIDPRVTSVRIMDPVTSGKYQYPNGYAVYMNKAGQTVDPLSGQTIAPSHPFAHIELP